MEQMLEGFQRLTQDERQLFYQYYDEMNAYWPSSLCFTEMVGWQHNFTIYYQEMDGFMVCAAWSCDRERWVLLPFFGHYTQDKVNKVFGKLDAMMMKKKIPLVVMDAAEWMKEYYEAIPGVTFEVIYDRGLSDYLYRAENFNLALQNEKNRYNYNYFVRRNHPVTVPITAGHLSECLKLVEENWCGFHKCEDCVYGCMKKTMQNTIPYLEKLDAHGILVYVENKPIAYCVVSCIGEMGTFHFKKTPRKFQGINEFLHRECMERFLQNAKVINYAEDMNLEGLRNYKSRLSEYTLAPRYELRKREKKGTED